MKRIALFIIVLCAICNTGHAQTSSDKPLIVSRWSGRVLICKDSLKIYTSFQWFKKNATTYVFDPIAGATQQYISNENGFNGTFKVRVTTNDNKTLESDPLTITTDPTQSVAMRPNPVAPGNNVVIESDSPSSDVGRVQIYSLTGAKIFDRVYSESSVSIPSPAQKGYYIVRIVGADGDVHTQKLTVR
jgi:hypothetical protein